MREYPVTVPNVFHLNSSSSHLFDVDDKYERKLKTNHDQYNPLQQQQSKYRDNHVTALNGDLSYGARVQTNNHNNIYNHSNKVNGNCNGKIDDEIRTTTQKRRMSATHGSYSILDAITNAVASGNCSGTIYPVNGSVDENHDDVIDGNHRNYLTENRLSVASQQPHSEHYNNNNNGNNYHHRERPHQFPSVNYKNSYLLWIGTPVAASFAVAIVIASLAGPQWLLTEEKIPNVNYNGTMNFNAADDGVYITKYTKSSLWILCFAQGLEYHCLKIDYFPKDEYSPDPNDSTMAIPYAIIKSTPFFLVAAFILVVSYVLLMWAMCSQRHSVSFFFSGIFFIISVFQPPLFTYRYGHSFILFVIGCISAEIVGTLNFFLFIRIREVGREKAIPCFSYPRSPGKERNVEKQSRDSFGTSAHYKCQKHPTVPKAFFSPFTQRRYFFERPARKCDVHQKNLTKSLNELYTEPAPSVLFPFDLPNEFPLTRSVSTTTDLFSNCSGGFGTGNSNSHKSLKTFTPQPQKRVNATNNNHHQQQPRQDVSFLHTENEKNFRSVSRDGSRDSLNNLCTNNNATKSILSNRVKSKDELFSEFCKRAGERPRPKDIYFIDHTSYDDVAGENVFVVENYATIRKNRRHSTSNGMATKASDNIYNSNQSLKDVNNFSGNKKAYPIKNIFDVDSFGGSTDRTAMFTNSRMDDYFTRSRSNSRDSSLYHSRTLPRDFLKRTNDFLTDHDENSGRRVSANGLYTPYNNSMTLPSAHNGTEYVDNYYKKSYDALASRNSRQSDAYTGSEDTLSVHWPNAIPGSPSSFSTRSQFLNNYVQQYSPCVQPNSRRMSSFYSQHFPQQPFKAPPLSSKMNVFNKSNSENDEDNVVVIVEHVDDSPEMDAGCISAGDDFGTFDLDRMEKERRKSHASLFDVEIDIENGTAV